ICRRAWMLSSERRSGSPEVGRFALFVCDAGSGAAQLLAGAGAFVAVGLADAAETATAIFGAPAGAGSLAWTGGTMPIPSEIVSPAPAARLVDTALILMSACPSADRASAIHVIARRDIAAKRSRPGRCPSPNGGRNAPRSRALRRA